MYIAEREQSSNAPENSQRLVFEVEQIERATGIPIESREDVRSIVEESLVKACEEFYDKNIRTIYASANAKDVALGRGIIVLDFDSLSEENQEIARHLGEIKGDAKKAVHILFPIDTSSTVTDLEHAALEIARQFQLQDLILEKVSLLTPREQAEERRAAFGD